MDSCAWFRVGRAALTSRVSTGGPGGATRAVFALIFFDCILMLLAGCGTEVRQRGEGAGGDGG